MKRGSFIGGLLPMSLLLTYLLIAIASATNQHAATLAPLFIPESLSTSASQITTQEAPYITSVQTYVVQLKQPSAASQSSAISLLTSALSQLASMGVEEASVSATYNNFAFFGFAASLTPAQLQAVRSSSLVQSVSVDAVFTAMATQDVDNIWALDRIDQETLPLDSTYTYTATGMGTVGYVMDTGIRTNHAEFKKASGAGSRVVNGADFVNDGLGFEDGYGHGTHVSSLMAGRTYGVAKDATIVNVRVLDSRGSGSYSKLLSALDWVANDVQQRGKPSVVNLSLGGPPYPPIDDAVANVVSKGASVIVAAGNSGQNACYGAPSGSPKAFAVGASDATDSRPNFSNYGECVRLFSPGVAIIGASKDGSATSSVTYSGTSMASPFAAGVALQFLEANPNASPDAVYTHLKSRAANGMIRGAGSGSPNLLLQAEK